LSIPFEHNRDAFIRQWERTSKRFPLPGGSHNSALFERSVNLLLAHEDKTYPGAMIASLSIPWCDEKSDEEIGGYHLVWTRDLVKSVAGLLAVGDLATPLRTLTLSNQPPGSRSDYPAYIIVVAGFLELVRFG